MDDSLSPFGPHLSMKVAVLQGSHVFALGRLQCSECFHDPEIVTVTKDFLCAGRISAYTKPRYENIYNGDQEYENGCTIVVAVQSFLSIGFVKVDIPNVDEDEADNDLRIANILEFNRKIVAALPGEQSKLRSNWP